jgi:hypothetical protein
MYVIESVGGEGGMAIRMVHVCVLCDAKDE